MSTHLYVPKQSNGEETSGRIVSHSEHVQSVAAKKASSLRGANMREHPGRRPGNAHGSWITDMGERKQSIFLCQGCQHKFNPHEYSYYRTKEFRVLGRCDACKTHEDNGTFFIHESLIGRKSPHCWTAR